MIASEESSGWRVTKPLVIPGSPLGSAPFRDKACLTNFFLSPSLGLRGWTMAQQVCVWNKSHKIREKSYRNRSRISCQKIYFYSVIHKKTKEEESTVDSALMRKIETRGQELYPTP